MRFHPHVPEFLDADFTCKLVPKYSFTDDEQDIIDTNWTDCQTYIDEYMQKAVMGTIDVDKTWGEYTAQLEEFGLEDVVKVHNAAYDRYVDLLESLGKE